MMIPDYVENYWRARAWEAFYFGIPVLLIGGIATFISAWQQHQEDMHVNDEPDLNALPPGKTLGL